ncbi:SH3 domain-binding protein 5-like, partial [Tropilaelaps mercedesae]
IQLERLNSCTDEINRLEVELDELNGHFRHTLSVSSQELNILKKKLDKAIKAARPYYESKQRAVTAQQECQRAAIQYQRASEVHQAATETIALAEQRFLSNQTEWAFDEAWQEMLNHATEKVTVAKAQMVESQSEHRRRAAVFKEAEESVHFLEERLKKEIKRSRIYFKAKERFEHSLEEIKTRQVKNLSYLCDQTISRLLEGSLSLGGSQTVDEGYSQSQLGSDSYLASLDYSISFCSSLSSSVSSLPDKLKDRQLLGSPRRPSESQQGQQHLPTKRSREITSRSTDAPAIVTSASTSTSAPFKEFVEVSLDDDD